MLQQSWSGPQSLQQEGCESEVATEGISHSSNGCRQLHVSSPDNPVIISIIAAINKENLLAVFILYLIGIRTSVFAWTEVKIVVGGVQVKTILDVWGAHFRTLQV